MQKTTESIAEEIQELFRNRGQSQYGGEAVTQLEHGLQAATFAEKQGASDELIVAALLHDVGHLLHDLPDDTPDKGVDDLHENLGAEWLAGRFPDSVLEPVRLHVTAKRYLCAADAQYRAKLSGPSEVSLMLQGGPMSEQECEDFRAHPFYDEAVRLRRWDDMAKIAGFETQPLEYFLPRVKSAVTNALPQTSA